MQERRIFQISALQCHHKNSLDGYTLYIQHAGSVCSWAD